eukprot:1153297-Pelagomonas_calceolata.AAC.13
MQDLQALGIADHPDTYDTMQCTGMEHGTLAWSQLRRRFHHGHLAAWQCCLVTVEEKALPGQLEMHKSNRA